MALAALLATLLLDNPMTLAPDGVEYSRDCLVPSIGGLNLVKFAGISFLPNNRFHYGL